MFGNNKEMNEFQDFIKTLMSAWLAYKKHDEGDRKRIRYIMDENSKPKTKGGK